MASAVFDPANWVFVYLLATAMGLELSSVVAFVMVTGSVSLINRSAIG